MTHINLRAAEARQLLDDGRVEVVRVMKKQPRRVLNGELFWDVGGYRLRGEMAYPKSFPAPGAVVACREPWWHYKRAEYEVAAYTDSATTMIFPHGGSPEYYSPEQQEIGRWNPMSEEGFQKLPASIMPAWAIRLHARVESRGAEVRDGKWCWVAWLVREKGGE